MRFWILAAMLVACSGGKDDGTGPEPTDSSTTDTQPPTTDTETTDTNDTETTDTNTEPTTPASTLEVADPTGDPLTIELAGACPLDTLQGGFLIQDAPSYTIIDGTITNGTLPVSILEAMGQDGYCTLLRRNNPFCNPNCQSDEACDFDGTCIPYPKNQNVRTVTVGGLNEDVIMNPLGASFNYFNTNLTHPAIVPGQLVELTMGLGNWGTETPAYDDSVLHGVGIDALTVDSSITYVIVRDQDLQLEWTPPTDTTGRAVMHVTINIDQHGNTPVKLFCDLPDTGTGAVPFSLLNQLIDFGVSGFPSVNFSRQTVDHAITDDGGCLDLTVASLREGALRVDGFVPCASVNDECPEGQTCDVANEICVDI